MINSFFTLSLLCTFSSATLFASSYETEQNYILGMSYLNGYKGVTMETKTMPNCPYERCSDIANKDGAHTFSYAKKDYINAIKYLHKSTIDAENPKAAQELLGFLQHRLNWREPKSDGYLVLRLKEDVGIDLPTYKKYFNDAINTLVNNKICDGYVVAGDISSGAYLGSAYSKTKAKEMYRNAVSVCPKDSYSGMIARQKLKDVTDAH